MRDSVGRRDVEGQPQGTAGRGEELPVALETLQPEEQAHRVII
jgi:hypothetical protein